MFITQATAAFVSETATTRSDKTAKTYRTGLNAFERVLKAHHVNPRTAPVSDLKALWVKWLILELVERDVKPATLDIYVESTRLFYEWASDEDIADPNMAKFRRLVKKFKPRNGKRQARVDLEALEFALQDVTQSEPHDLTQLRNRALIYSLATTGLRLQEAVDLKVSDIDFDKRRTVLVGKGDREDTVYWSAQAIEFLSEYLEARDATANDPLFVAHNDPREISHRAMHPNGLRKAILTVTGASPHKWRHYSISRYLKATRNLKATQRFARHASVQTTLDRYAHLLEGEVQDLHDSVFE